MGKKKVKAKAKTKEMTVKEVLDSMTEDQKTTLYFFVGEAVKMNLNKHTLMLTSKARDLYLQGYVAAFKDFVEEDNLDNLIDAVAKAKGMTL